MKARDAEVLTHRPTSELFFWPLGAALVLVLGFHFLMALRMLQPKPVTALELEWGEVRS